MDATMAQAAGLRRTGLPVHALLVGAILLAAFVYQVPRVLNPDLAWLLTVAERLLQGQRLGVDVIELNPPASVLLYMPAAWLGLHGPVAPEIWVIVLALAGSVAAVELSLRLLGLEGDTAARARLVLLAVLVLAPLRNFGQREHLACVGLLPFVALAARRGSGRGASWRSAVLAGLGGGLAMCIKPYFVGICAFPLLWNAVRGRSLRPLLGIECWVAGALVVGYFGAALIAFPQYFREYPAIVALTYLPYRQPLGYMLTGGLSLFALLLLVLVWLARGTGEDHWRGAGPWMMAVAGGVLSYVAQGKDFGYVRVPMVLFALCAAALAPLVLDRAEWTAAPPWRRVGLIAAALAMALHPGAGDHRAGEFIGPLRELAPPRPSILAVADASEIGQPLTRLVHGTWASGEGSQLFTAGALNRLEVGGMTAEQAALARRIVSAAHTRLRDDILRRRPDVLLIDGERFHSPFDWLGWMRQDPLVAAELDRHYRMARTQGRVGIWIRQPAPAQLALPAPKP